MILIGQCDSPIVRRVAVACAIRFLHESQPRMWPWVFTRVSHRRP
jgi:hypothetical protein